ncbi:hypothetical protein LZC95_50735 [Pendulispora brunnea]|uniref:Uncharacterized protein n=1 Tax=Pendulispora brunnea TaxID=2905690 RepID=A0ABZ2K9C4_9BACT
MKLHTFVGWGISLVGICGLAACGTSDGGGDSRGQSPLAAEDEVREAAIDLQSHIHENGGYSAAAWFRQGRLPGPGWKEREIVTEGNCTSWYFEPGDETKDPSPVFVGGGDIALSGALIPPSTVLRQDKGNDYPKLHGEATLWQGGEDINIATAGHPGGVGPFKAVLKAPSHITLSKPIWDHAGLTIDRAQDLGLEWTSSGWSVGTVKVRIEAMEAGSRSGTSVRCAFPVYSGAGVVSTRVLKHLPHPSDAWIQIEADAEDTVTVSPWNVRVRLHSAGTLPNGQSSQGSVTFK